MSVGADETANPEIKLWGEKPAIENPKDHVELAANLGMISLRAERGLRAPVLMTTVGRAPVWNAPDQLPRIRRPWKTVIRKWAFRLWKRSAWKAPAS